MLGEEISNVKKLEKRIQYHILINELELFDQEFFLKQFRMSPNRYEELLRLVGPTISKSSNRREAITADEFYQLHTQLFFTSLKKLGLIFLFALCIHY